MEDGDALVMKGTTKFKPLPDVKNIMVTGGAGFIAGWLVRHLVQTYPSYKIVCFDKLDYSASLNNIRCLECFPNFVFHCGDITSSLDVMSCLQMYQIDTVFHFAAQSHVDLSFFDPFHFTTVNVYGTHVMLDCSKTYGIGKFIHISTDEVYGEIEALNVNVDESCALAPTNPYAASKAAAEMLVNSYRQSFKLPTIIVRPNNVYGGGQFPEKIIPKFTLLLDRGQAVPLHGDGRHTRRYLYAADAADALDTILHRGSSGCIYNIDSEDEVSNLDLCQQLTRLFDLPGPWTQYITYVNDRPFNDRRYNIDGSKLRALGWKQNVGFEMGLKYTVNWYRNMGDRWWDQKDMGKVISAQFTIPRYLGGQKLGIIASLKKKHVEAKASEPQ